MADGLALVEDIRTAVADVKNALLQGHGEEATPRLWHIQETLMHLQRAVGHRHTASGHGGGRELATSLARVEASQQSLDELHAHASLLRAGVAEERTRGRGGGHGTDAEAVLPAAVHALLARGAPHDDVLAVLHEELAERRRLVDEREQLYAQRKASEARRKAAATQLESLQKKLRKHLHGVSQPLFRELALDAAAAPAPALSALPAPLYTLARQLTDHALRHGGTDALALAVAHAAEPALVGTLPCAPAQLVVTLCGGQVSLRFACAPARRLVYLVAPCGGEASEPLLHWSTEALGHPFPCHVDAAERVRAAQAACTALPHPAAAQLFPAFFTL